MLNLVSVLAVLMAGPGAPIAIPQIEEEHLVRWTYETPHLDWGKPWARGTIRTLMFCVGKYEYARDLIELGQRFDMDLTPVYLRANRKVLHFTTANVDREVDENPPDSDGIQRVRRLLHDKWDLFLFANVNPDVLPPELQYFLYKQVSDGAGLLCVGPRPQKVLTEKRQLQEPPNLFPLGVRFWALPAAQEWGKEGTQPEDLERQLVHAYALGKGRGVHLGLPNALSLTPNLPASPENLNELEYWYALVGELGIWAAGRDVDLRQAVPAAKVRRVRSQVRRLDGFTLPWYESRDDEGAEPVQAGARAQLQGTSVPAGLYVLVTFTDLDGKRAAFSTTPLSLGDLAEQRVEAVALHRDFCEPGDPLEGTVTLSEADHSGLSLRVETRDAWGRILARRDLDLTANSRQVPFTAPTSEDCSIYMRLEASLYRGDEQVTAPKVAEFRVTQRRRGSFHQVMWDAPSSAVGYWAMLRLRQLGYDVILGGLKPTVALTDMPLIPYTTRLMEEHDEQGIMKPCCWNDPEASEKWIGEIVARQEAARKHGVYVYSLGDETTTKGCCVSEHCLRAYRQYLKQQYGTVEALNRSWGARYSSFDEVTLSALDDNYEKTAFQQGNYARWYDRQAYSLWNYLQLNARFGRKFKDLDSQALTGFEGAGGFGDDIEGIVKTNGFYNPYPSIADEVLRSVSPKGYIRGNWIGYQRDAEPLLYWYWRIIMNGCPCVFWWRWDGIGIWHGYLAPDFEPYAATAEMDRDTEVVRQGLGDLLIQADREDNGLALLYSVAMAQADRLPDSGSFGGVRLAHETWVNLTRAAGFGFRYVTDRQLEAGELRRGVRVLVLPFTRALSDKTVEEVKAFVEAGGTVIADLRPGDFTEHLARREKPALDELFGVNHAAQSNVEPGPVKIASTLGGQELKVEIPKIRVERGVTLSDGKALTQVGDTPLLVTREIGRGRALLLNMAVADLAAVEASDKGPEARRFLAALYRACGVSSPITVDSDDPQVQLSTGAWRAGKLLVYGVQMRNFRYESGRYRVQIAQPMHVYDLKDGKYLGKRSEVNLPAVRTRFLAFSPEKVTPVAAALDRKTYVPGDRVVLRMAPGKGNPEGLYAVGLRVYDPSGAEQLWARRSVVLGQPTTTNFALGLNAAGGQWRVATRDLITGQTADLWFTVSGSNPSLWPGCYVPH